MKPIPRALLAAAAVLALAAPATAATARPAPVVAARAGPAGVGLPGGQAVPHVKPFLGSRGPVTHPAAQAPVPGLAPTNVVGGPPTAGTTAKFLEGAGAYVEPSDGGIACDASNCIDFKNGGITVRNAQDWTQIRYQATWGQWFSTSGGFFTDPLIWRHPYANVFDGAIMFLQATNHWHFVTFTTRGPNPLNAGGQPNYCFVDFDLGTSGTEWDYPHPSASSDAAGNGFFGVGFNRYANGAQNVTDSDVLAYPQPLLTATSPCPTSVNGWVSPLPSTDFTPIPGRIIDAPGATILYGYSRAFDFPSTSFRAWKATIASNGSATFSDHAIPFPSGVSTTVLPGASQKGGQHPLDPLDGRPGSAQYLLLNGVPTLEGAFGVQVSGHATDDAIRVTVNLSNWTLSSSTIVHVANDHFIIPSSVRDRVCNPSCTGGTRWAVSGTLTGPDYYPSTAQVVSSAPAQVTVNTAGTGPYNGNSCARDGTCRWGDQYTDDVRPGVSTNVLALFATLANPGTASGTNPGYQINVWGVNP